MDNKMILIVILYIGFFSSLMGGMIRSHGVEGVLLQVANNVYDLASIDVVIIDKVRVLENRITALEDDLEDCHQE